MKRSDEEEIRDGLAIIGGLALFSVIVYAMAGYESPVKELGRWIRGNMKTKTPVDKMNSREMNRLLAKLVSEKEYKLAGIVQGIIEGKKK